uniref:hypothetical protein n=1 Tax=Xanthomonas maliensis TaxID=1321368 RepID=UPI00057086ED
MQTDAPIGASATARHPQRQQAAAPHAAGTAHSGRDTLGAIDNGIAARTDIFAAAPAPSPHRSTSTPDKDTHKHGRQRFHAIEDREIAALVAHRAAGSENFPTLLPKTKRCRYDCGLAA